MFSLELLIDAILIEYTQIPFSIKQPKSAAIGFFQGGFRSAVVNEPSCSSH